MYLNTDYRVTCDGDWVLYAVLAGIGFVIYPLGIPFTYWYLLHSNRAALHDKEHPDHSKVYARLSFIYRQYGVSPSLFLAHPLFVICIIVKNLKPLFTYWYLLQSLKPGTGNS